MKQIKDLKEIEGLNIKRAALVDYDETLVLVFENSYFCVDVEFCGDSHSLRFYGDIDDHDKVEAGLMSRDKYNKIQSQKKAERDQYSKQQESNELARLKAKYEGA